MAADKLAKFRVRDAKPSKNDAPIMTMAEINAKCAEIKAKRDAKAAELNAKLESSREA